MLPFPWNHLDKAMINLWFVIKEIYTTFIFIGTGDVYFLWYLVMGDFNNNNKNQKKTKKKTTFSTVIVRKLTDECFDLLSCSSSSSSSMKRFFYCDTFLNWFCYLSADFLSLSFFFLYQGIEKKVSNN